MRVLDKATYIEANAKNFSQSVRKLTDIKYIVFHYTSNTNDTARNNAIYFRDNVVQASAHFFVRDDSIYQSVPINHAAWAVGLGSMKKPYFEWPSMWKKINNNNSVSIELCGSATGPEANDKTKQTGAKLAADLMDKLCLTPACLYRHYDVTGKPCPKWAVDDPAKWLELKLMTSKEFYGEEEKDIMALLDNAENYAIFKTWMTRYMQELADAAPDDWEMGPMDKAKSLGLMDGTRPHSYVKRSELATVLTRLDGLHK